MYKDISEIPEHVSAEIMHFFEVYKQLEYKNTSVDVVADKDEAINVIVKSMENYKTHLYELTAK